MLLADDSEELLCMPKHSTAFVSTEQVCCKSLVLFLAWLEFKYRWLRCFYDAG